MPAEPPPRPPEGLSAPSRRLWRAVVSEWHLDRAHLEVLRVALEARDRLAQARLALRKHGLVYVDRFGAPRMRPEVAVERDSRIAYLRALRQLDLDETEVEGLDRRTADRRRARTRDREEP